MRTDEYGDPCPSTLGEYRAMCICIGGPDCEAVRFLDTKISESSPNETVIVSDNQMRRILFPRCISTFEEE